MTTITVHGSHGSLTVHQATGLILARDPGEYDDIVRFDPVTLTDDAHIDILRTGFWHRAGYEPRIPEEELFV